MSDPQLSGEPISEAEALQRLRQTEDPSQRYYAAWWLGRMRSRHPDAVPLLLSSLSLALCESQDVASADDLFVARNAARALGKLQAPSALTMLLQALEHPDHDLREAAARSIGELGDPMAIPALSRRLQQPRAAEPTGQGVRLNEPCEALLEALGDLSRGQPNEELLTLIEPFSHHERPVLRSSALRALLMISGEERWANALMALLKHEQLQVRRAVLMDVGACGWRPAGPALANCLAENSLKLIALKGLVEQPLQQQENQSEEKELLQLMDDLL